MSELRVTSGGKVQAYVTQTLMALQNSPLLLKAEGSAVSKAVTVAEIVRRRLRGLHQNTQIGLATGSHSDEQRTSWPPMPSIAITLSTAPLDPTQPG